MAEGEPVVLEIDTANSSQGKAFLELPYRLYRETPQWVPPLRGEAQRMLDRRRNPFFKHSDAAFWIAMRGGRAVGRLAALKHRRYNTINHEATAFFYLFECEDSPQVARLLFEAAFA